VSASRKILVAVMCDSFLLEKWMADALRQIVNENYGEIVLTILNDSPAIEPKNIGARFTSYKWNRLLWNRFHKRYGNVDSVKAEDVTDLLGKIAVIRVRPFLKGKYSQHFSASAIEEIRKHQPDVILRFGFNILRGEILNAAPLGVWSYHHCDPQVIRGGPGGFWEYLLKQDKQGAILQRLTDKLDDGIIIRQGWFRMIKHSYSENLNQLLEGTSSWMADAIREVAVNGSLRSISKSDAADSIRTYPGNFTMLKFLFVLAANKFAFHFRQLFTAETWMIGIADQSLKETLTSGKFDSVKWIKAPKVSMYLADPFTLNIEGRETIICEKYDYQTGKGVISEAETDKVTYVSEHHLSYPYPLTINSENYFVPEASESKHLIAVHAATKETFHLLKNIPCIDATVFQDNGLWWIFTNRADRNPDTDLFVYWSEKVEGPYQEHLLNPVRTDIAASRPAGNPLIENGKLTFPMQKGVPHYGAGIAVVEITKLSPTEYEDQLTNTILPQAKWHYNEGLHTVSHGPNNTTLIDAKAHRFIFANFSAQLKRKIKRIFN
jgi:hypothetical protein